MPIACNPWLEANQREGKVSIKQSQALSLSLSFFISPRHQMPFFHCFFDPALYFSALRLCLHLVPMCLPAAGQGWGPRTSPGGGSRGGKSLGQLVWSRDSSGPRSHPYSTLYFPGKHLLSSLAQQLASNLSPHSCLVMPIRVYASPAHQRWEKKRLRGDTGREMENGGIEREGQGQFPESHKAKPEPLGKTNKKDRTPSL